MAIKSQDAYEAHRDGYDAAAADDARELKRLDREIILQLDAIGFAQQPPFLDVLHKKSASCTKTCIQPMITMARAVNLIWRLSREIGRSESCQFRPALPRLLTGNGTGARDS